MDIRPEQLADDVTLRFAEPAGVPALAAAFVENRGPWILVSGGRIAGAVTLSGVVLGPFRSASLGYWIAADRQGRGLATAAVERVCRTARETAGLHRLEASTRLDNPASQRVLEKAGFEPIGMAPRYPHIGGEWRDHRLFQRILHDGDPTSGS
ncbi:GNAT family N-acetyltransferase [Streptomyces prunicolor]|uniref:GNAT family N-acetyltransferase n=1 Tax=Streptomyces prunicolor TaxID=67348 RepID=UPI00371FFCF4